MTRGEHLRGALLVGAALLCGGWSAFSHLLARPQAPQVTHVTLDAPGNPGPDVAAPSYPRTASIAPLISGRLNLNTASREQLEALPKVGPALAARLLAGRPYASLADLDRVKGVGPKLLETLAPLVSF